ncbi:MAG: hypothetical protein ACYDH4_10395 [Candidatus Cryosericum sp.]
MKSIACRNARWALLVVLALTLTFSSGCGVKPITRETLDYFYDLVNQQYWQRQPNGLALDDEYGTEQLILAQQGTSDKEQQLLFGDVCVTSSSQKSGPTDAMIKIKVFDGSAEKEVRARVSDTNRATLEKMLAETFESKTQRDQRLKEEAYAAKLKGADALLGANKVADAIGALKAAQVINNTDEVKTRLDAIYVRQGEYYYSQKKYDAALTQLKLVSFDSASLKEAQGLLPKVQAEVDKAAAEKVATDRVAAQRRTWFRTLDGYYWEFGALQTIVGDQTRDTIGPSIGKMTILTGKIIAYCDSHRGMNPSELDQMRVTLTGYVQNMYNWSYNFAYGSADTSVRLGWVYTFQKCQKEYLRIRGIVAQRYGY